MSVKGPRQVKETAILGWPPLLWFAMFLAAPLFVVLALSFFSRGIYGGVEYTFTLANFARVFEPVYFLIFTKSLQLSFITAVICLLLAYPMAWAMAAADPAWRKKLVILLAVPFFTNLIIRVYAVKLFVNIGGPLQALLQVLGVPFDQFGISQNVVLVFYGMVTTYLPFMVFPLYAAFEKFDFSLIEAAEDLGASPLKILLTVIVPNTRVAALSGFTLVFVPCMGEFVIPDLLGGAKTMLAGNLITEQFLKARDWTFGAALSVVLMTVLLLVPVVLKRIYIRKEPA